MCIYYPKNKTNLTSRVNLGAAVTIVGVKFCNANSSSIGTCSSLILKKAEGNPGFKFFDRVLPETCELSFVPLNAPLLAGVRALGLFFGLPLLSAFFNCEGLKSSFCSSSFARLSSYLLGQQVTQQH